MINSILNKPAFNGTVTVVRITPSPNSFASAPSCDTFESSTDSEGEIRSRDVIGHTLMQAIKEIYPLVSPVEVYKTVREALVLSQQQKDGKDTVKPDDYHIDYAA